MKTTLKVTIRQTSGGGYEARDALTRYAIGPSFSCPGIARRWAIRSGFVVIAMQPHRPSKV